MAALYQSAGGDGIYRQIDMEALLAAHDLYLELSKSVILRVHQINRSDLTQAWIIAGIFRPAQSIQSAAVIVVSGISARCLPPSAQLSDLRFEKKGYVTPPGNYYQTGQVIG